MGKKLDKIRLGSLTEVWHGGYDGVEVKARIDVMWKNRSRLGQCAGADWDTFDAAKLMIFSETVAF